MGDPFYEVKDKVATSLVQQKASLGRADELIRNGATLSQVEAVLQEVRSELQTIHTDVKDLAQTITIVEENRARFHRIDNRELDSRRAFVNEAKTVLAQYEQDLQRITLRAKTADQAAARRALMANSNAAASAASAASSRFDDRVREEATRQNDDMIADAQQRQQLIENQQNAELDTMSVALERLSNIAQTTHTELEKSKVQLDALDQEIDEAQGQLQVALRKMEKLLKSSDKGRLCCIVLLFFLAIVLFFAIIYG